MLGPVSAQSATLHDLNRREIACVIPLALALFVIGLYPTVMLDLMHASVTTLGAGLRAGAAAPDRGRVHRAMRGLIESGCHQEDRTYRVLVLANRGMKG